MLSKFLNVSSVRAVARCAPKVSATCTRRWFVTAEFKHETSFVLTPAAMNRRLYSTSVVFSVAEIAQEIEKMKKNIVELNKEKESLNDKLDKVNTENERSFFMSQIVAVRQEITALQQQISVDKLRLSSIPAQDSSMLKMTYSPLQEFEARAVQIWQAVQDCTDLSLDAVSNPEKSISIPWPSMLTGQEGRVVYSEPVEPFPEFKVKRVDIDGREWFKTLYEHTMSNVNLCPMNVMGNKGVGKTHRLAALVALLLKENRRVVYLPHCGYAAEQIIEHLCKALLVAFGDPQSAEIRRKIMSIETEAEFIRFIKNQSQGSLVFVFDQYNAILSDSPDWNSGTVQRLLGYCASSHFGIRGHSANSHTVKRLEKRQRAEFDLFVFGGLSIKEFKFWCNSKSNKAMFDGVDKSLKIDLYLASGGVPLMLEDFKTTYAEMMNLPSKSSNSKFEAAFSSWSAQQHSIIFDELKNFFLEFQDGPRIPHHKCKDVLLPGVLGKMHSGELAHVDHRHMFRVPLQLNVKMSKCFIRSPMIPENTPIGELWKHLYCTSGIAHRAALNLLSDTTLNPIRTMLTEQVIRSAKETYNVVMRGILIERIVLAHIGVNGLPGWKNGSTSSVCQFTDSDTLESPKSILDGNLSATTLYIPRVFNYPRIDAVLVHFEGAKSKNTGSIRAHITFIQVTAGDKKVKSISSSFNFLKDESARKRWLGVIPEQYRQTAVIGMHWFVPDEEIAQKVRNCVDGSVGSATASGDVQTAKATVDKSTNAITIIGSIIPELTGVRFDEVESEWDV